MLCGPAPQMVTAGSCGDALTFNEAGSPLQTLNHGRVSAQPGTYPRKRVGCRTKLEAGFFIRKNGNLIRWVKGGKLDRKEK